MFQISLDLSDSDLAALNLLSAQERLLKKAASRALNKTARWLRTFLSQEVASELSFKVSLVRPGIVVIGARQNTLRSEIGLSATSGVIKAKNLGKTQQNTTGVKAGKRQYDRAFLATMKSGHDGVFKRKGGARLPIREQVIVFTGKLAELMQDANDGVAQRMLTQLFEREYRALVRSVG